jgi:hypothetical protein
MMIKLKMLRLALTFQQVADIAALIDISQDGMSKADREKYEIIKVKCIKLMFSQISDFDKQLISLAKKRRVRDG